MGRRRVAGAGSWIVATHFLAQFFATGFFMYSFPLLFEPVIAEFDTDATSMNYLPMIAGVLGLGVAPVAGPLVDRWSARGLLIIGTLALVAGLVGISLARSITSFIAIGALAFGVAMVLMGPLTGSAVISRWFTATRGRALGIAAIGTSVGGILLPKLLGLSIESIGWRVGLQGVAAAVALLVLPLLIFRFWDAPDDASDAAADGPMTAGGALHEPEGAAEVDGTETGFGAAPAAASPRFASTREILSHRSFWLFSGSLALFLATYTPALANLGHYFADVGLGVNDGATLLSLLALSGIAGKLAFGYLADRMPLKLGLLAAIAATGLSFFLFSLEPGYPMLLMGAVGMGLATGGILPVWNAMVPAIFGVQNFGRTMGLMSPVISLSVTPVYPILGAIRDATGSYVLAFQLFMGVLLVAALLLVPLRVPEAALPGSDADAAHV